MPYDPSPEMNEPRQSSELPIIPIFPYPSVNRFRNVKQRGEFFLLRSEAAHLLIFRQQDEKIRFLREIGDKIVSRFDYLASQQWLLFGQGSTLFVIDLPSGRELARKECNGQIGGISCWNERMFIAFANNLAEVELSYGGKLLFADVIPYPEVIVDIATGRDGLVVVAQSGIYDGQCRKIRELAGMEECIQLNDVVYIRHGEGLFRLDSAVTNGNLAVQAGKTVLLRWQGVTLSSDMVLIDGGKFLMSDPDRGVRIKPTHQVKLDRFFIGKYPVTFAEYDTYCEDSGQKKPSDNSWGRDSRPVIIISWWDAIKYCNWRSNQEGWSVAYNSQGLLLDANGAVTSDITQVQGYRLPTEAEWEYAARGGQKSQGYGYSGSNSLEEVGWYTSNSGITTQPVGEKKGNELGLYDMSGNVWEWCYDLLAVSEERNIINPIGAVNGDCRAFRGGSYTTLRSSCRVAQRGLCPPENSHSDLGFRLVRSAPVASNEAIDTPGSASDFVLHPNLVSPELPFIGYGLTDDEQNLFLVLSDGRGILISLATERIIARFPHLEADDLRQCPHMKMFPDALVILRGNEVSGTVGWEKYIAFIRGSDFCEDEALYQMHYRPLREMLNATN